MSDHKLTPTESQLLALIFAATLRIQALSDRRALTDDVAEWVRRKVAIDDLKAIGVRVSGDWIGTAPADRQQRRRGLQRLADAGLLVLSAAWGRSTTHAKLTPEGRRVAESLAIAPEPEGDR